MAITKAGHRYSYEKEVPKAEGQGLQFYREHGEDHYLGKMFELVNARVVEEARVFDGYCRDHEVNLKNLDEQAAHMDCDCYTAFHTVFRFDNGDEIRKDEVLDRNGYCAMHSGHSQKLGGDTPSDCMNPHDHCVHGTYVGGCGIDWMCGACEMGSDYEEADEEE